MVRHWCRRACCSIINYVAHPPCGVEGRNLPLLWGHVDTALVTDRIVRMLAYMSNIVRCSDYSSWGATASH